MPVAKSAVYVHNYDDDGNPVGGQWYQPGDEIPSDAKVDNPAVWGETNDDEHMGYSAPPRRNEQLVEAVNLPPAEQDEAEGYASWTKDQLQNELGERQLPTSGNKAELVERLEENDRELAEANQQT